MKLVGRPRIAAELQLDLVHCVGVEQIAKRFAPEQLEAGAAIINEHPGVSHNYRRNHEFNLWFTLATPPGSDIDRTLERLHELRGAIVTRKLQTLKLFKIGVKLDMTGTKDVTRQEDPDYTGIQRDFALRSPLSERDIAVIRAVQDDLPLIPHPYVECARAQGLSEDQAAYIGVPVEGPYKPDHYRY